MSMESDYLKSDYMNKQTNTPNKRRNSDIKRSRGVLGAFNPRQLVVGLLLVLAIAAGAIAAPSTLSLHTSVTLPVDI